MTAKSGVSYVGGCREKPYVGSYDRNGNLYLGGWSYDVENRLISVDAGGGEQYVYDGSNKWIYKQTTSGESYFFYGIDGKLMGEYLVAFRCTQTCYRTYYLEMFNASETIYFPAESAAGGGGGSTGVGKRECGQHSAQRTSGSLVTLLLNG